VNQTPFCMQHVFFSVNVANSRPWKNTAVELAKIEKIKRM